MTKGFLALALMLTACSRGPQAPSAAENEQLDEIERTLDAEANREGDAD